MREHAEVVLLLFDIDGTLLLKAAAAHREALLTALKEVHHVDPPNGRLETAGRTDGEIARCILLGAGVDARAIDDRAADVREAACAAYARLCPDDLAAHVAPGVPDVLDELAADGGHTISLVTGNLEPIARLKLARAGIGRFFPRGQGGFGSDSEDRAALPAVARRRAGANHRPHPRADTVVIGDTPLDIRCAQADGVRCIGVATGEYRRDALAEADVVVQAATDLPAAIAAL